MLNFSFHRGWTCPAGNGTSQAGPRARGGGDRRSHWPPSWLAQFQASSCLELESLPLLE